ncbi:HD domain-containing protein [Pseudomaricurvus alkylphenolicus]|uniref:HD-GYP domain-containing protein n=1 Tax=Pseudomaricurvus alkylphenolicus TaxID=1306991 RepID=UPI00141DBA74|nr:HD domain-containing phosphohydrolase [Pseudomaricurvus alkylphenolicus]NIB43656.1 HD domain-containing protein [Pseudomaricurvus alkylphenolicus]
MLDRVFQQLDQLVLQRTEGRWFIAHSQVPEVLAEFFDNSGEPFELGDDLLFLDNFLIDADAHWQSGADFPRHSGTWYERSRSGVDVALEAIALTVDGSSILVIEAPGVKHELAASKLQAAREHLLTEERLEQEMRKRTAQIREREEQIALRLLAAAGFRDEETGAHVRRIGMYSEAIAKHLGWPQDQVDQIRMAAPMHDIGKIGIPDYVLLKPGKLTKEEWSVMKRHAAIGAEMLANTGIPMMDMASDIARFHHERWDGTGYPDGLLGEAIPISCRITAIVDVYDALVHERVYKPAYDEPTALNMMRELAGNHLDPNLFEVFLELLPEIRRIRQEIQ